jgi:hypothetical protein
MAPHPNVFRSLLARVSSELAASLLLVLSYGKLLCISDKLGISNQFDILFSFEGLTHKMRSYQFLSIWVGTWKQQQWLFVHIEYT